MNEQRQYYGVSASEDSLIIMLNHWNAYQYQSFWRGFLVAAVTFLALFFGKMKPKSLIVIQLFVCSYIRY